jgi:hypothetical protein
MRLARTCFCAQAQPPQVRQTGWLRHAWSSSPASNGDVTARSRMEQSDEGSRGRSQLVRSSSRRLLNRVRAGFSSTGEGGVSRRLRRNRQTTGTSWKRKRPSAGTDCRDSVVHRGSQPGLPAQRQQSDDIAASTRRRPQQHCVRRPHAKGAGAASRATPRWATPRLRRSLVETRPASGSVATNRAPRPRSRSGACWSRSVGHSGDGPP